MSAEDLFWGIAMTEQSPREKAKGIEIATCVGVFVFGFMNIVGSVWHYYGVTAPESAMNQKKQAIELRRLEAESVSVNGDVWAPSLTFGDDHISLCPVVVSFKNEGHAEVEIDGIEFRVFTASLSDVIKMEAVDGEDEKAAVAGRVNLFRPTGKYATRVGVIDVKSPSWVEKVTLRRQPTRAVIAPGQKHTERFHLLAPRDSETFITMVEVTAKTKKTAHKWSGFANPAMCGPFDSVETNPVAQPAN